MLVLVLFKNTKKNAQAKITSCYYVIFPGNPVHDRGPRFWCLSDLRKSWLNFYQDHRKIVSPVRNKRRQNTQMAQKHPDVRFWIGGRLGVNVADQIGFLAHSGVDPIPLDFDFRWIYEHKTKEGYLVR